MSWPSASNVLDSDSSTAMAGVEEGEREKITILCQTSLPAGLLLLLLADNQRRRKKGLTFDGGHVVVHGQARVREGLFQGVAP